MLQSCGLRRAEALALRVSDVQARSDGGVSIIVRRGKGGRSREVPVLPGSEVQALAALEGLDDAEARVFPRLPSHLDVHALRRSYAQQFYQWLSGRPLPPSQGRLRPQDYDREAVLLVSQALGHRRRDVVLTHYLR